jgi:hypothetical protein
MITLTCTASDEDDDNLTYQWEQNANPIGTKEQKGIEWDSIQWQTPATPGEYTITCTVSDGSLQDTDSLIVLVGQEKVTIQQMIDAASNGQTITLAPGTYLESGITFPEDKQIILEGDINNPASVIIDGNLQNSVFILDSVPDGTAIRGLTIQNGNASTVGNRYGGGIRIIDSSPTIEHNIIRDNILPAGYGDNPYYGSGISVYGSSASPVIRYNEISHNIGSYKGSAICIRSAGDVNPVTVEYNTITDNQGSNGTVYIGYSSAIIKDNIVNNNTVSSRGGAIRVLNTNSVVIIEDNDISNNVCQGGMGGGGIYSEGSAPVIRNNNISGNVVLDDEEGGGIYIISGEATITGNTISNNTAYKGGGIYGGTNTTVMNNSIANNTATYYNSTESGAGIYRAGTILDNIICGNNSNPQAYDSTYEPNEPPGNTVCPTCTGSCAF